MSDAKTDTKTVKFTQISIAAYQSPFGYSVSVRHLAAIDEDGQVWTRSLDTDEPKRGFWIPIAGPVAKIEDDERVRVSALDGWTAAQDSEAAQ